MVICSECGNSVLEENVRKDSSGAPLCPECYEFYEEEGGCYD